MFIFFNAIYQMLLWLTTLLCSLCFCRADVNVVYSLVYVSDITAITVLICLYTLV